MKVAIIGVRGYPYVYGGYETFAKELSERLVGKGIDVTIYCHRNLFEKYPQQVNGIDLVYIPTIEKKSLSQFIHSFFSIIHACFQDYDIILVVNPANGPFGLITKLFNKKTVINVDGLEWLRPKWKGIGSRYFYLAAKLATKLYDVIINDSAAMAEFYKREFATDSVVIEYGANIRYSKDISIIKKRDLSQYEYYLIVGRLIPDNNAYIIIREFLESNSKKKLVVVGDDPYGGEYARRIKLVKDSRVIFTGYINDQDELAELYHNCFAYFHGHEFGGTNPAMLKALAYGCAVIALDTPFNREMCNNEKHALYFSKEKNVLKNLIEYVETNSHIIESMRKISRQRILEKYTWEEITEKYISLFNNLVGGKKIS